MSTLAAAALSLAIPGLGQVASGRRRRGLALIAAAAAAIATTLWLASPVARFALLPLWLLSAYDAYRLAGGRRPRTAWLILAAVVPFYYAGWQATVIEPHKIVSQFGRVQPLLGELLRPNLFEFAREEFAGTVEVWTPCPDHDVAVPTLSDDRPSLAVRPSCAPFGEPLVVQGAGFPAGHSVAVTWISSARARSPLGSAVADSAGRFEMEISVPVSSVPLQYQDNPQRQRIEAVALGDPYGIRASETLRQVLGQMGVTIAVGLMATLLGALIAVPFSILGARNLMPRNPVGSLVYYGARLVMNVLRSIEPLILVVVFVVWVGQGPYAGMLALAVHSMAALGKLYSEQIEAIDPGPVEAVRSTGARWLQTVVYAALPQVVPPFTAFTVYRWDINVRMSTVLGFAGGGGIGALLIQWIQRRMWSEVAVAVLVIAIVVMMLDFLSAAIRERIVEGRQLVRRQLRPIVALLLAVLVVWAWFTTEIQVSEFGRGVTKIRPIMGELMRPELLSRQMLTETARTELVIPCDLEDVVPVVAPSSGPSLGIDRRCADAGEIVSVTGTGFTPGREVTLKWLLPAEQRLRVPGRQEVSPDGGFEAAMEVRPLLAQRGTESGEAIGVEALAVEEVGWWRMSHQTRTTGDLLIETVLMALMATTFGAILALPLSLLGARNMVPRNIIGTGLYYLTRTYMNVLRAIEPLILTAIFAVWIGYGVPFVGVLALMLVTQANLGKLFSESVESIDTGPLEAIWATGARRIQVIVYGVFPQIVPPFLSFGMYQWDINVRMSTVIGFVSGAGIGHQLLTWMDTSQWSSASVAILGIILVVSVMDWASAQVREELV